MYRSDSSETDDEVQRLFDQPKKERIIHDSIGRASVNIKSSRQKRISPPLRATKQTQNSRGNASKPNIRARDDSSNTSDTSDSEESEDDSSSSFDSDDTDSEDESDSDTSESSNSDDESDSTIQDSSPHIHSWSGVGKCSNLNAI